MMGIAIQADRPACARKITLCSVAFKEIRLFLTIRSRLWHHDRLTIIKTEKPCDAMTLVMNSSR